MRKRRHLMVLISLAVPFHSPYFTCRFGGDCSSGGRALQSPYEAFPRIKVKNLAKYLHAGPLRDGLPVREAPLCRQQSSTAPRAHSTGALLFFIHGVQSRFPDIFHTLQPWKTHTTRETGGGSDVRQLTGTSMEILSRKRVALHRTQAAVFAPALKNTTQEVAVHSAAPRAAKKKPRHK